MTNFSQHKKVTSKVNSKAPITRTKHASLQFLISNEMQEQVAKIDVLNSVCSDHSPVIVTFKPVSETSKNTAYWKFNGSLLKDKDFCKNLAIEIENLKISLANFQPQEKWELLKFKIRAFCIKFSKKKAKERKDKINKLEEITKRCLTEIRTYI